MKTGYQGWPLHMSDQEIWSREHQVLPTQSNGGVVCAECGGVRVHKVKCKYFKNKVKPTEDPIWGLILKSNKDTVNQES